MRLKVGISECTLQSSYKYDTSLRQLYSQFQIFTYEKWYVVYSLGCNTTTKIDVSGRDDYYCYWQNYWSYHCCYCHGNCFLPLHRNCCQTNDNYCFHDGTANETKRHTSINYFNIRLKCNTAPLVRKCMRYD